MKTQKVEMLEKARYNAWLVQTIGFILLLGTWIIMHATGNETTGIDWTKFPEFSVTGSTVLFIGMIISVFIFLFGTVLKRIAYNKIRSDEQIRKALNNELYVQYGYKTYFWGFWALLISLLILFYVRLDTPLTCLTAIFAGVLTKQIATLIYYRSGYERK